MMQVIRGRLYLQTSERILRPATAVYHSTPDDVTNISVLPPQPLLNSETSLGVVTSHISSSNETHLGNNIHSMTSPTTNTYCSTPLDAVLTLQEMGGDCCHVSVMTPVNDCINCMPKEYVDCQAGTSGDGNQTTSLSPLTTESSASSNSWTRSVLPLKHLLYFIHFIFCCIKYFCFSHLELVVCGNLNFGSVSVFKKPNRIVFVKLYFTVTAVLYKTVSDNNRYQTYIPSFNLFRS